MRKVILSTMVLLVCVVGSVNAAIYTPPTMIELSYNASNQKANDINNAGQITGTAWDGNFAYMREANGDYSYLYAQTAAGVGTHGRTYGNAINSDGDVAATGSGTITGSNYQPLVYTSITPPAHAYNPQVIGASGDRARAINSQYVAGYKATYMKKATIWDFSGSEIYTYGDNYQNRTYVDVSENNIFIGQVENAGSIITHYDSSTSAWVTETYEDPGYGSITQFTSINGDGTLFCGYIRNSSSGTYYSADVWGYDTSGDIVRVATLSTADSSSYAVGAAAISPNGQIVVGVGKVWRDSVWEGAPAVWEDVDGDWTTDTDRTMYTFESLLPVTEQGLWENVVLTGVNDSGDIVGYGNYNGKAYQSGFVFSPNTHIVETGVEFLPGDANGDGVVSAGDYAAVQANFGNTLSTATPSVPEPATLSLLVIGGIAMIRRNRR